jgi:hypothetical protein
MERLKHIKEKLIETVCDQMDHLESVDATELGEVVDMIKDIEQIYYYSSVVHAMKEKDEVSTYYYNPILLTDEEGMYHLDHKDSHKLARDPKEGIS